MLNLDIFSSEMLTVDYIAKFVHSCLFELCISTVNTLTICSCDAGPEQSLVLFAPEYGLVLALGKELFLGCDKYQTETEFDWFLKCRPQGVWGSGENSYFFSES